MRRTWSIGQLLVAGMAILSLLARPSAAQDTTARARGAAAAPSYRDRLLGVFDGASGEPVEGAEVIDLMSGTTARTTRTGTVSLGFLPDGGALVRVRKLGYELQTMMVPISPADTVPVTVVLQPVVRLPEVVTTGRASYISPQLRAFEERRHNNSAGYFISEAQLRRDDGRPIANMLLSHIPGLRLFQRGHNVLLLPSVRCINSGPPDVYVDGMPWPHPLSMGTALPMGQRGGPGNSGDTVTAVRRDTVAVKQPIDLSEFDVDNLAGVEYYPDELTMPLQFHRTTGACGVLLLWTRER